MTTQTITRPSPLRRLASFSQRHHWTALLLWVVVLVGVTAAAQSIGDDYRNSFDIPGTQSQEMADLQAEHGGSTGDQVRAVIHDERGWNTDQQAVDQLLADLAEVPHVETVEAADPQRGSVSEDGTTALVTVVMDAEAGELPVSAYEPFLELADETSTDDLQVEMAGDSMREVNEGEGGSSEGMGMLAALVIMLFMFGSFLAESLPLITAIFAVGTTFGVVTLLSHLTTIPDYTAPMLMIVGLGVGIDYALLVFSRYRSELLGGATREHATATAIDTRIAVMTTHSTAEAPLSERRAWASRPRSRIDMRVRCCVDMAKSAFLVGLVDGPRLHPRSTSEDSRDGRVGEEQKEAHA